MNDPVGYRIEPFEPTELAPAQLREAALFQQALEHERVAGGSAHGARKRSKRACARTRPASGARSSARAIGAARSSAIASLAGTKNEPGNQHLRWCEVAVSQAHRRRGLGRSLLRRAVQAVADQRDDIVFIGQVTDRIPRGGELRPSHGRRQPGLDMKTNQLDLSSVDRAKVERVGTDLAAGYRLERVDGTVPAELIAPHIQSASGMNDAPRGDLRMDDWELTEEQIRDREAWLGRRASSAGSSSRCTRRVGRARGSRVVTYDPRVPHLIWQQGTAVSRRTAGIGSGCG